MRFNFSRILAALLLGGCIALSPSMTVSTFAESAAMNRSELDAHMRDYIMTNPRVIREALQNLEV